MGFPWADVGGDGQSNFAAQRQSRANSVVARAAARAESLSNEISDLRGNRQRAAENFGEYELADIKWRASNIKAGRRSRATNIQRARHPDGPAAPLQRMSHSDAQVRTTLQQAERNDLPPCGEKLGQARRLQHGRQPLPQQQSQHSHEKLPQFKAFRSHTADPDLSERHDLSDLRRRARRDRHRLVDGGSGPARRRTIGGSDDAGRLNRQHNTRPRKGPVIPRLDLSKLAKYQVGHEQEEKQLVRKKKKKKKKPYSYQEEHSFYLPQEENTQWQDANQYLQSVNFEDDDSFRNMAQQTY